MSLESEIGKEIPKRNRILGFYDDEEERWIKFPLGKEIIGIKQINRFVKIVVREIKKLKNLLKLKKLDLVLEVSIGGYRIDYTISLDENIEEENKSIATIVRRITITNRMLKTEKVKAKFTKLLLTFYET